MHWYREGHKQRSRILYVFRTPGGAPVGRKALEPDVLRTLETEHPSIAFDWKSVIANQQVVESAPEPRRPRKRRRTEDAPPPSPSPHESSSAPEPPRPPIPSALQGATPDEQIAFLAHWYPIIRERIRLRTSDPVRREALLALAERLNPAAWTDADEIVAGLPRAAEALERLSRVFARRRRRSRRPAKAAAPPTEPAASDT